MTITVSTVYNDGRNARPWTFTSRTANGVLHHRDHQRERAESRRQAMIDRLTREGHKVVETER